MNPSRHQAPASIRRVTARAYILLSVLACSSPVGCGGDSPTRVGIGPDFTSVVVGEDHTCGIVEGGRAYCWGFNQSGQLGDGTNTDRFTPTAVAGQHTFTSLNAGITHTCGLTSDGTLYCWGRNSEGQLGDGSTSERNVPTPVSGGRTFVAVSAGGLHTCALTAEGIAYCWGSASDGQLGDGRSGVGEFALQPTRVTGGLRFDSLSAGGLHACGVTREGAVHCWGSDSAGALGTEATETCEDGLGNLAPCSATPVAVTGGSGFTSVSAGVAHTCGVAIGGTAFCWGRNRTGQLGDGTTNPSFVPAAVAGGLAFMSISAGNGHSCGLLAANGIRCWGANHRGQIGDGSEETRLAPTAVNDQHTHIAIGAGGAHTCALSATGTAYCWGLNREGELGVESTEETCSGAPCSRTPLPVRVN